MNCKITEQQTRRIMRLDGDVTIGILHKLKYIFPKDILLTIYKSLILPHLNYGLLLDISVLQKKAIRVVTNNTYKSHTEPIFKEIFYNKYFTAY